MGLVCIQLLGLLFPSPFSFCRHDLFGLLSINQQRMCLNELEVYLKRGLLIAAAVCILLLLSPPKSAVIKTDDIGILCFLQQD